MTSADERAEKIYTKVAGMVNFEMKKEVFISLASIIIREAVEEATHNVCNGDKCQETDCWCHCHDRIKGAKAEEREACARLLETSEYTLMERIILCEMAKAIRARGENK
jgi:hypothetical protein